MVRGVGCLPSRAPSHPSLRVRKRWGHPKERRMVRVSGISPPMAISSFNNTIDTLERAVLERVFYVRLEGQFVAPPKPRPHHFHDCMRHTMDALRPLLPRSAPMSPDSFVDTFRGPKRVAYDAAREDLLRSSFTSRDAEVKVFVKYEKTDFTRKADPVPRVISPRSTRYNVEVGCFLRPIEERIFKSLANLFGHPTVFKGMNSSTSGRMLYEKWSMFTDPVAVGLDASRFDQHVSVDALSWEHDVYLGCHPHSRHRRRLAYLLRHQLRNVCVGYTDDGRLKYKTEGGRMSGDMNTSLGNCVLMCSMIHAYAHHVSVKLQLANNGDDCVVFMEARDLSRFMEGLDGWFTSMGFSMAVESPCYLLEEVEFCQTHPVFVGPDHDSYVMVRHPRWAIAKDTVSIHNYDTPALFAGWLHAVGTGGMALAGGIPVFQEFYAAYLRAGKYHRSVVSGQSWGVRQLAKGMKREYCDVLPATRASFYWAFGITPDEQLVQEEFYRSVKIGLEGGAAFEYQPDMPM